jgi:glycosyltransferase involved in cell wall biosynthesis
VEVGLDGTPLLGPRTGIGWYTYDLVSALAAAHPGDRYRLMPISWRTARGAAGPPGENVEVVTRFAPARPLWALWDRVPVPPLEALLRCDVFHAVNYLAPRSWRTPTVVTVHDLSFVRHPEQCAPPVQRMAQQLPAVLRRAAAVITVSRFAADEVCEWLPELADRVVAVPNAPHPRPDPTGPPAADGRPTILLLGALGPRKNIPLLLDALLHLRRRGLRPRVVLAGPADPMLDVAALLRDRGLDDGQVEVTGWVDDGRAGRLLRDASVLAFPSRYEGFGMPVLEAMAAGTAVVAVRAAAVPEVAGDAAELVEPEAEAFAEALHRVLTDDSRREALEAAGRERSAQFTWERTARETHTVYRSVV